MLSATPPGARDSDEITWADGCDTWPIWLPLRSSVTTGKPLRTQRVGPELVNCSDSISCPGLAPAWIARTVTEVQVERAAPAPGVCVPAGAGAEADGLGGAEAGVETGTVAGADDGAGVDAAVADGAGEWVPDPEVVHAPSATAAVAITPAATPRPGGIS